jgi:hypothetical protein
VRYNSIAPLDQRLRSLRLPIGEYTNQAGFLSAIRGARVEVRSGSASTTGRLLSVENKTRIKQDIRAEYTEISVVSDSGDVRTFELGPGTSVRIADRDLNEEVGRYMNLVSSTRERDLRRMTISSEGSGDRNVFVSYISEVPVWKSTYRIVLPTDEKKKPFIQGWAIVDNTVGEDWKDVELSLVAGSPQSFVQNISQPHYSRRPVIGVTDAASLTPQSHEAALRTPAAMAPAPVTGAGYGLAAGSVGGVMGGVMAKSNNFSIDGLANSAIPGGSIWGVVKDPQGAVISRAQITATGPGGTFSATSDDVGNFAISGLAPGSYHVEVGARGFENSAFHANVSSYAGARVDAMLPVGAGSMTVNVEASAEAVDTTESKMSDTEIAADASELGELFEYKLKQRVTIGKNQSALVPILQSAIDVEKVSIWNQEKPNVLRALWLTNNSGLSLDGGTFNIVEGGAFAGEGIFKVIKPNERRLLSYAADQSVHVVSENETESGHYSRVRVAKGIMTRTTEYRRITNYTVTNTGEEPRSVVIEHGRDSSLKLSADAKPAESTENLYRFKVEVKNDEEKELKVTETRPQEETFTLSTLNDDQLALFIKQKSIPASLEAMLRPIVSKKGELAGTEQQIRDRQMAINTIGLDQSRLRENMKALKGSPEEKALLQRYTKQLNDQEDRLESIRKEIAELEKKRDTARADLNNLVMNMTFDEAIAAD